MEKLSTKAKEAVFHGLKVTKKRQLTNSAYALEFAVPEHLKQVFHFQAGQYVTVKHMFGTAAVTRDFSITSAPFEEGLALGIKVNAGTFSESLLNDTEVGTVLQISEPQGRFTIKIKPAEHRTILAFAAGIGITPILSQVKTILREEKATRFYLFYGNKNRGTIAFDEDLKLLQTQYSERFFIYHFFSEDRSNLFYHGHLDEKKLALIINQILHSDDTDEESTVWDNVDEVLICGPGPMVKNLANACFQNGIPKKNIHFELFKEFNEDIYPQEQTFPLVENIAVNFQIAGKKYSAELPDNRSKILQQLLSQGFDVPYSCKSGICGVCECRLESGDVELLENEYLTEKEEAEGRILPCSTIALSKNIELNFDVF